MVLEVQVVPSGEINIVPFLPNPIKVLFKYEIRLRRSSVFDITPFHCSEVSIDQLVTFVEVRMDSISPNCPKTKKVPFALVTPLRLISVPEF